MKASRVVIAVANAEHVAVLSLPAALALHGVFGLASPYRLPLHIARRVGTATGQRLHMINDVAGARA